MAIMVETFEQDVQLIGTRQVLALCIATPQSPRVDALVLSPGAKLKVDLSCKLSGGENRKGAASRCPEGSDLSACVVVNSTFCQFSEFHIE
jgi:hypothetical protein